MRHTDYGFTKTVKLNYDEALNKTTEKLKEKGFGVLTEIDVRDTMKKKLNADLKPYKILGACNPPFALEAIKAEEQIGLMLPCNVIVYVNDKNDTVVAAVDPVASMMAVKNKNLSGIAISVRNLLKEVIEEV
ncbi:MAG: DUF302 domain-containing protein [Ignavibacteria bacterium]|nr:DUF302 domain-containing protein [Ignavibacteria bacterium]